MFVCVRARACCASCAQDLQAAFQCEEAKRQQRSERLRHEAEELAHNSAKFIGSPTAQEAEEAEAGGSEYAQESSEPAAMKQTIEKQKKKQKKKRETSGDGVRLEKRKADSATASASGTASASKKKKKKGEPEITQQPEEDDSGDDEDLNMPISMLVGANRPRDHDQKEASQVPSSYISQVQYHPPPPRPQKSCKSHAIMRVCCLQEQLEIQAKGRLERDQQMEAMIAAVMLDAPVGCSREDAKSAILHGEEAGVKGDEKVPPPHVLLPTWVFVQAHFYVSAYDKHGGL